MKPKRKPKPLYALMRIETGNYIGFDGEVATYTTRAMAEKALGGKIWPARYRVVRLEPVGRKR